MQENLEIERGERKRKRKRKRKRERERERGKWRGKGLIYDEKTGELVIPWCEK